MAATDFGALSSAQKKVWAAKIWMAGRDENFLFQNGFIGEGKNSPIERVTELTTTERGDRCIMQLVNDLTGDGVVGDNLLENNEEALINDSIEIVIDMLRHGVRSKGAMSEQRTVIRFRSTTTEKLSFWIGDKIDELGFLTLAGMAYTLNLDNSTRAASQLPQLAFAASVAAPSSGRQFFCGAATSTANIAAGDTLDWVSCVEVQAFAKRKKMKPIRSGGRGYYILVASTEQLRDLKTDTNYMTNVGRAANRGSDNPLFKNAVAVIDGLVIYDHNKVPTTQGLAGGSKYGAGGAIEGAQALLLGAQALGFATLGDQGYTESDNTDYGNRPGIATGRMLGMLKPQFNSIPDGNTKQDFGVISVYSAAAA